MTRAAFFDFAPHRLSRRRMMSPAINESQAVAEKEISATGKIVLEPAKNIPGLTSLRFFAAMAVVFYHTLAPFEVPGLQFFWRFTRMGGTGVSVFFILSGFILFYTYERALGQGQLNLRHFLCSRLARIYPVYLVGLALSLPGFAAGLSGSAGNGGIANVLHIAVAVPLLLQSWDPATACRWNCPGWSLSAEVFFYALFPVIGFFVARLDRSRTLPMSFLAYVLIVAAPLYYLLSGRETGSDDINAIPDLMILRFNPLVRLPEFVLGILAARCVIGSRWKIHTWGVCLAAMGVIAALYGSYYLPPRVGDTLIENGFFAPLFVFLIVAIAKGPPAILAGSVWVRLGAASYALYIVHIPIWGMFKYSARAGISADPTQNLPIYLFYLAVILIASFFVHRWVEVPSMLFIKRWTIGNRSKPVVTPSSIGGAVAHLAAAQAQMVLSAGKAAHAENVA